MINTGGREFVFALTGDASGIESAARRATGALDDTANTTTALDHAQGRASASSEALVGRLAKLGASGYGLKLISDMALSAARSLIDAQVSADRLGLQLTAAVGGGQAVAEMDYVRQTANKLGLELNSTAVSYARFAAAGRGTSLEGRGVREVFDSVSKAAAVMGLNLDETQGVLRALEQMLSKGTVQAEELRGQLGDRLPGALQIAARALGVTTGQLSEMVQQGQVIATEFLPKFAAQLEKELGDSAEKAGDRMQGALNRATNAWEQFKQALAGAGAGDRLKDILDLAADRVRGIAENLALAKANGGGVVDTAWALARGLFSVTSPLDLLVGGSKTLEGRLSEASKRLAELQEAANRNPYDVYITKLRDSARELVTELTRARDLLAGRADQSAAETNRLAAYQAETTRTEEEAARRRARLKAITDDLTGENTKLAKSLKVLKEAFDAGDLSAARYQELVSSARSTYGPRGAKEAKPAPPVNQLILDSKDAYVELARRASVADAPIRDFMLDQVQKSDERLMNARERQLDQAARFVEQLVSSTDNVYAGLIPQAEARGQALLAIEKAQLQARASHLRLDGAQRQQVEDEITRYIMAREVELTDQLRPEWQRRLEAWQNTTELMREAHADVMLGFVEQGEQAFTQWLRTGQNTTRGLVNYIADEFAKLAYRKYIGGGLAGLLDTALSALLGGGSLSVDSSGLGIGATRTDGQIGLPTRGGAATGTNFVQRDMLTILHKGEAVIPKAYNPDAGARGASERPVVLNVTYNVPDGQSPASYAAALEQHTQRIKAEVAADMARPGRLLQRAVVAAL